jgi:hypothetical protein
MSNTLRKDRNGKVFKESIKKHNGRTRCRCEYCSGVDRNVLVDKIAEKELKEELKKDGYYYDDEIIWDKQCEFCNDYCCTVRDDKIVEKYVINSNGLI